MATVANFGRDGGRWIEKKKKRGRAVAARKIETMILTFTIGIQSFMVKPLTVKPKIPDKPVPVGVSGAKISFSFINLPFKPVRLIRRRRIDRFSPKRGNWNLRFTKTWNFVYFKPCYKIISLYLVTLAKNGSYFYVEKIVMGSLSPRSTEKSKLVWLLFQKSITISSDITR